MMKTGIMILLMAAGILTATLNSTTGPEDEERNQELEDILRTPTFNNSTLTNSTREFDDVDEDILEEEELSDAETNSSNMSKLQIALWVCVAILALLASLVIFIFVVKGRKERSEAQAIKDQDKRQEKIEGLSIAKRDR